MARNGRNIHITSMGVGKKNCGSKKKDSQDTDRKIHVTANLHSIQELFRVSGLRFSV
jgi:hypothetical protein